MTLKLLQKASAIINPESSTADDWFHDPAPGNSWGMGMAIQTCETDNLRRKVDQMSEKLDKLLKQNEAYHATSDGVETGQEDTYQERDGWVTNPNDEDLGQDEEDDGCQDDNYENSWVGEDEMPELASVNGDLGVLRHEGTAEEGSPERVDADASLRHEVALSKAYHELDERRDQVKFLQAKVAGLWYEKHQLARKVKKLEGKRDDSTPSRHYFLSSYKLQKLHRGLTADECEHLLHASTEVPSGDVLADSELYVLGDRKDYDVFVNLYGVVPQAVPSLLKHTIELINAHATTLASKHKTCTPTFEDGFARFIKNLQRTGYPEDYHVGFTDDVGIPKLRSSYTAFSDALHSEVRDASQTEVMNGPEEKQPVW
ncbi:hypothetical protein ABOM_007819 [Aspergillus bombycis]|uniref:Uncharacterized protein n=1 Tax=Aspergillus bombycis TaxID=109264 RepID=A0A1F7ZVG0_9EURO|nr:hypothetical protein ABOM_007819 [Aspergillus bombycis]OGM43452.1 hypothetical protein ABOM_007819 [Aspergillus bombycis]